MRDDVLACVEVEPSTAATASVIWLHGLGADGHDFEPIVPHLQLTDAHAVRFVFPHAPRIPVTINMGLIMPAWYDIGVLDLERGHDLAGVERSAKQVRALVARENSRGIPSSRIVLAGFSQGGAVALWTGLRHAERLAGLLALSTYCVGVDRLARERSEACRGLGVFQAHGQFDPMVPLSAGTLCREQLVLLGYDVEWRTYPMAHEVVYEELADIGAWLRAALPPSA